VDWTLAAAALGIGVVVGLTGMGGGALMTPVLVLMFGTPPLTAISSDLVAVAVMKPVGGFVHLRRGTVRLELVKWLCIGSAPVRPEMAETDTVETDTVETDTAQTEPSRPAPRAIAAG
jgi:uncharacterized protein